MRYSAFALFFVLLALIGAWIWLIATGGRQAALEARELARSTITQAENNFLDGARTVDLLLEGVGRIAAERDFSTLSGDTAASRQFADLATRIPFVQALWLIDAAGKVVLGNQAVPGGSDFATSDFFLAHASEKRVSFIGSSQAKTPATYLVVFSRRIDRGDAFAGVALAMIDMSWFRNIAENSHVPPEGGLAILSRQGNVVASTWSDIGELDASLRRELAQRAFANGDFASGTVAVRNGGQEPENFLLGYRPVKGLNLVALYAVPYVTTLQAWSYQLWIGSAIIAAAIAIIIGGAIVLLVYGRRQGDLHRMIGLRTAEAAQAAERLALAIDTTGIGIFDYRMGGRDIAWAGVEPGYFGLRPPPDLTPRSLLRSVHPADRHSLIERLRTMKGARDDTRYDTEFRLRHPEFGAIWVAARAKLFIRNGLANGNGRGPGRLIGTLRDITERRRLQEHRETVLREINHRIKNSLQLMNSIMNLQSRRITSLDERARFESARRRLISLATVYAHLDDTTQPDVVDLVPFLRRLCQDFSVAYMADGRINLSFAATGGRLIAATLAVPLGMAMGEILVNISLTGFMPQATGTVAVNVTVDGDRVEITIAHNGRSVEDAFSSDGASLGKLLIDAFVDQLGGTFKAENRDPGLLFTLRFRAPPVPSARPLSPPQPNRPPA